MGTRSVTGSGFHSIPCQRVSDPSLGVLQPHTDSLLPSRPPIRMSETYELEGIKDRNLNKVVSLGIVDRDTERSWNMDEGQGINTRKSTPRPLSG